jgi:hypothetical protein
MSSYSTLTELSSKNHLVFADIDECAVNVPQPCPGHCTNIPGNYSCPSPNEKPLSYSGTVLLDVDNTLSPSFTYI